MHWPKFLAWNAAGGIAWAVSIGLLGYFAGQAAVAILHAAGYVGLGLFAVVVIGLAAWTLFRRRG